MRKKHKKKYQDRPSPPYSANDCPDQTLKGNDGKMYKSIKTEKGYYVWKLHNDIELNDSESVINLSKIFKELIVIRNNSLIMPKSW